LLAFVNVYRIEEISYIIDTMAKEKFKTNLPPDKARCPKCMTTLR